MKWSLRWKSKGRDLGEVDSKPKERERDAAGAKGQMLVNRHENG